MPAMSERIAVGVDGSPSAERALSWAAAEARRRQVGLDVVLAYTIPVAGGVSGYPPPLSGNEMDGYIAAEQQVLSDSVTRLRKEYLDLDVHEMLVPGGAAGALSD